MTWEEVRTLHAEVAAAVASSLEGIPSERWLRPRAEGKWTPAEVAEHLTLVYEVLLLELGGGGGMRIRTTWWQRLMLRYTLLPKLLRGEPFPAGARTPRETRPAVVTRDQQSAIFAFREKAAGLESAAAAAVASGKPRRLTHAYFGTSGVVQGVLLCTRHLQHHHQQLKESLP